MKYLLIKLGLCLAISFFSFDGIQSRQPNNTLSKSEKRKGWQLLFDGKSLSNWRGFKGAAIPAGWSVEDGTVVLSKPDSKDPEDLLTIRQYSDFELKLEWKISEGGNSGIMFYVSCDPPFRSSSETGPEIQVLDNDRHPDGKGEDGLHRAGATYDLYPAAKDVVKPVGEFNQIRIKVYKGRVENWLNGRKVVDYTLLSPEWEKKVSNSKFAKHTSYGRMGDGHIALQDHGDKVWYRNIKIREL